ncbi:hypothetical protein [Streptomyces prunicolor]|uniref:hypothetical protein n=1 Tax=Streptomyces prunicolor TaxID=67348 RepID=UPI00036509BA|nr:hypothetical protein [Streptomyces prunicolor]
MGGEAKLIDPSGIPHFIGDLATLDTDVMLLTADAGQFRASGSDVHTEFQGLSAFYEAPEAEQLFATTLPVKEKSDAFADDLEKVATALSDYGFEVQPLVDKLDALKTDATAFVNSVTGDDDWRKDQDKVDHNNDLWHDVNHTVAAFQAAERTAYNKIMALIGGTGLTADDGSHGKNMYGYNADDLDHAEETPWGTAVEREYEGWAWLAHQSKQVWDGIWHDGVIATIHGLGTMFGSDGWDAAGEAWKNLAKLGTASWLTTATLGAWWLTPDDQLPSWLRDSRTVYKQTVKGFVAYDQWKTNPARAAGAFGFNVLTVVGTEGVGGAASGAGKAGAAARTLSVVGKVGRAIDPMTYIGKVGKFAFVKVGDTFATLKNLHTGTYLDMANLGDRYTPAEHPVPLAERPVSVPDSAIEYVDAKGNPVYLTRDGHVLDADGSVRQHVTEARTELSADDRTILDSAPRTPAAEARVPEPVTVHGGDNLTSTAAHTPAGAAPHLPNGSTDGLTHGPSASHETPGARGHSTGQGGGEHAPGGSLSHDTASAGDHTSTGHGAPGAGGEGGTTPPSGGHDLPGGTAPEPPRGNLPDGSWEGENGLHLSPDANAAADDFIRQSTQAEPRITDTLQQITHNVDDGRLIGLEYRLKGEDSLKRKLATALLRKSNVTPEGVLSGIKDSVRYTVEFPSANYAHGVQEAVDTLRSQGFDNVTFKDTWNSPGYKGINSTWRDPVSGRVFEVQFHTPESFAAKMDGHILYEKERLPGVSPEELTAIRAQQGELFGKVPVPHGVEVINLDHELPTAHPSTHAPDTRLSHTSDQSVHGNGPPTELAPAERTLHDSHLHELAERYHEDFDRLKQDPDHKGKVRPSEMDEARVALDLRESGKTPSDIQRPPGADQGDLYSPSTGTFYDIKGVHSDWPPLNNVRDKSLPFKGAYDPADNGTWVRKLNDQIVTRERVVILDMRNANQAAIDDVKAIVEEHGWSDRVVWYP